ncbi:MAG: FixH family protein [Minicystis sp.]
MSTTAVPLARLAPVLAAAALLAGCSGEPVDAGAEGFPEAPLATVTSDGGAVTIEVRTSPTQPPSRGRISVEYRVTAAPAGALDLDVLPWMPDMGHGASTKPTVEDRGGGRYVVTGVDVFMPGRWELRTTITGAVTDSAIVPFQIP